MTTPLLRVYNPRDLEADVIDALLTGRDALLEEALADLKRQASPKGGRQHWLLRGPRGYGKTHFLGALRNAVLADPVLAKAYLPVWLPETAVYSTYSTAKLLVRIAEQIGQDYSRLSPPTGARLANPDRPEKPSADEDVLAEAEDRLRIESRERARTILVLCENFDVLLDGFSRNRRTETKRLRRILEHDRELLFVFTTPARQGGLLSDPRQPLYGMFRDLPLKPLGEEDVRTLITRLDSVLGSKPRSLLFADTPDGRHRLRTLHRLAGGNPRAVVMAYQVLAGAREAETIVHQLRALLDAQTAYFESILGRFAARERAIMAAMCLSSTTMTLSEIAASSRLSERSLSVQVGRLVEGGHLEPADGASGKGAMYEVTDGLFRLWYQYREGHLLLDTVIGFLSEFHSADDLRSARLAVEQRLLSPDVSPLERSDARIALLWLSEAHSRRTEVESARTPSDQADEPREVTSEARRLRLGRLEAIELHENGDSEAALARLQRLLPDFEGSTDGAVLDEIARTCSVIASLQNLRGGPREGLAAAEQFIARFGSSTQPAQRLLLAEMLFNRGVALGQLGRAEDALRAYDEVAERFGASNLPGIQEQIAKALVNRGITLEQLGRAEDELAAYGEVVERFGTSSLPELQEVVAAAIGNRGITLGQLGRADDELRAYDEVVERFGASDLPALQHLVAKALVDRGIALVQLGRAADALDAYAEVVERFGTSTDPALQEEVSAAIGNRGITLGQLGRADDELRSYDEVVERFGASDLPALQHLVAQALVFRGIALVQLGRAADALDAYAEVVERVGTSDLPALHEQVAIALVNRGVTLERLGRTADGLGAYAEVVERFGTSNLPGLQEPVARAAVLVQVARALFNRGVTLGKLGRIEEEIAAFTDLLTRFTSSTEPKLRWFVRAAEVNAAMATGTVVRRAKKYDPAVAVYRELVGRAGESDDADFRADIISARAYLAHCLFQLGRDTAGTGQLEELFKELSGAVAALPAKGVDEILRLAIATSPLGLVREQLELLAQVEPGALAESARLYLLVVHVMEEGVLRRGRKTASGPRVREKKALRRVPPELRSTVAELAEKLNQERVTLGSR